MTLTWKRSSRDLADQLRAMPQGHEGNRDTVLIETRNIKRDTGAIASKCGRYIIVQRNTYRQSWSGDRMVLFLCKGEFGNPTWRPLRSSEHRDGVATRRDLQALEFPCDDRRAKSVAQQHDDTLTRQRKEALSYEDVEVQITDDVDALMGWLSEKSIGVAGQRVTMRKYSSTWKEQVEWKDGLSFEECRPYNQSRVAHSEHGRLFGRGLRFGGWNIRFEAFQEGELYTIVTDEEPEISTVEDAIDAIEAYTAASVNGWGSGDPSFEQKLQEQRLLSARYKAAQTFLRSLESAYASQAEQHEDQLEQIAKDGAPLYLAAEAALADLEGIMPEFEASGDREHPGWQTIEELRAAMEEAAPEEASPPPLKHSLPEDRLTMIHDPGHGWLVVPIADVEASGINVSRHSYWTYEVETVYGAEDKSTRSGNYYLEQDKDATAYLRACGYKFGPKGQSIGVAPNIQHNYYKSIGFDKGAVRCEEN
jgi:hypothetical protein